MECSSNPAHTHANNSFLASMKDFVKFVSIIVVIMFIWVVIIFMTSPMGEPNIQLKSARLINNTPPSYDNNTSTTSPFNVTLIARVNLTNPSFSSFHYGKISVSVVYENSSVSVGVSESEAVTLEAQETKDLDLTVQMKLGQKELVTPNLTDHVFSDMFKLRSYAKLSGIVHVLKVLTKRKTIQMSCAINLNLTSFSDQPFQC